jgi:CheY-like chemotaxis protein
LLPFESGAYFIIKKFAMLNHILLIDDDEDEHLFFQWSVENVDLHLSLLHAHSSGQAESMLRHVLPDIIFLDINLPVVTGFECLHQLRNNTALKNVPIYMYSTEINEAAVKEAMQLGASGCLKKSRDNKQLSKNIIDILNAEPLLHKKSELK